MNEPSKTESHSDSHIHPRSVYLHVPFCAHRCGYCNFTLVAGRDYLIERFLNAIEQEIHRSIAFDRLAGKLRTVDTIYLGGGTPSRLSPEQIRRLGRIIRSRFELAVGGEFTAECNPVDFDAETAVAFSEIGVNRISLGAQSLNASKLKRLERDHSPEQVRRAVTTARSFARSVSVDFIFATPEETLADWKTDLAKAIELPADHFSIYELTYEKGTSFWSRLSRGQLSEVGESLRSEMYAHTLEKLESGGWERYEVSSFSRAGHRSRHNSMYWTGRPFYAFGPGASGLRGRVRTINHQSTTRYLQRIESGESAVSQSEELSARSFALEMLVIGLRQVDGVNVREFERRTGMRPDSIAGAKLESLVEHGLLTASEESIRLTARGLMLCDTIAVEILD